MNYNVDGNKLIVDGKVVFEAPSDIDDTLVSKFNPHAIMIIYDGFHLLPDDYDDMTKPLLHDRELQKLINQNVLCLDKDGKIIWRIDSTFDYPQDHIYFIEDQPGHDGLWTYRRDARKFKIDPQNGKILDWKMGI